MDAAKFEEAAASLGIILSPEQVRAFESFEEELYKANEVMNLTRIPRDESWLRHFIDSLLFNDLIPEGATVLDIGTGPGFPAWPLAVARPDLRVTALDSSGKMLSFLRRMSLPNLEVVQQRAEDWGVRDRFDVVTGRALAPLPAQLELSAAATRRGGFVIPMRSASELEAISSTDPSELGLTLRTAEQRTLPTTDIVRVFPVYEKVRWTPRQYPRKWAEIRKMSKGA